MTRLDRAAAGAHRRAQRIRDGLTSMSDTIATLIEVQERSDWLALGYQNYAEYCERELSPDKLRLTAEQRAQLVGVFLSSGMSRRTAAKILGVSDSTVRLDAGARNRALGSAKPQVTDVQGVTNTGSAPEGDGGGSGQSAAGDPMRPADGDEANTTTTVDDSPASGSVPAAPWDGPDVTPQSSFVTDPPAALHFLTAGEGGGSAAVAGQPGLDSPAGWDAVAPSRPGLNVAGVPQAASTAAYADEEPSPTDFGSSAVGDERGGALVTDPADVVALLKSWAVRTFDVEVDIVGPLLTGPQLDDLAGSLDDIARMVGVLENLHTAYAAR